MKRLIELSVLAFLTFAGVRAVAHDDAKPCTTSPAASPVASLPVAASVAHGRR